MNIHVQNHAGCNYFTEFLKFNNVDHNVCDLYREIDSLRYPILPSDVIHNVFVVDADTLVNMLVTDIGFTSLKEFLQNRNILIMGGYNDGIQPLVRNPQVEKKLNDLDCSIPTGSLILLFDTHFQNHVFVKKLTNIKSETIEVYQDWNFPRISGASLEKTDKAKDFLVTARLKSGRPHRQLLKETIESNQALKNKGIVHFNDDENNWVGEVGNGIQWVGGHPSMDLYRNCYFEIVSETYNKNYFLASEKITKPIRTKTAFLAQSTSGYLKYLKNIYGLKTFSHLINEDYDNISNEIQRTKRLVQVAEHIVSNGSRDFYKQAQDVLEHNFYRSAEISGLYTFRLDQKLQKCLDYCSDYCK